MSDSTWAIMPVLAGPEMTENALADLLAQSVPVRVLLINQGVDNRFRDRLERLAEQHPELYLWHHNPPLPSLAATWNRALDFAWETGATEAFVCNNDVRLHRETVRRLTVVRGLEDALFVSAVGVTANQFDPTATPVYDLTAPIQKGGPDFSCYLIAREGHLTYRFDEDYIPAYGEDIDLHRRYLLGGDGDRIFSVNLPFQHERSGTLRALDPAARQKLEAILEQSRAYHARKWGGGVNEETFLRPFDSVAAVADGTATTPYLQAHPPRHVSPPPVLV